jgi:hypothetical protein
MKSKDEYVDFDHILGLDDIANRDLYTTEAKMSFEPLSLSNDMRSCKWFLEKIDNDRYAQNVYAALCNNEFIKVTFNDTPPTEEQLCDLLSGKFDDAWSVSWRGAGRVISELQGRGDYMSWYCSGITEVYPISQDTSNENDSQKSDDLESRKAVPEGCITDEVMSDLRRLGWAPINVDDHF